MPLEEQHSACQTRLIARASSWLLALSLMACGTIPRTLVAPHAEYAAYRDVRTSRQLEQRLARAHSYLMRYPDGRWVDEVRPWFVKAESDYFERRQQSIAGVTAYLRLLPDGPHAAEARTRLDVLRQRERTERKELLGIQASISEQRLAQKARERESARDELLGWVGRFLAVETWGEPTRALPHELIFAWRIEPPAGRCVDDDCRKLVELPYEMPGGGSSARRVMILEVVLELRNGVLVEARVQGPGLFSRFYEAAQRKPVDPADLISRIHAIAFAADALRGAVEWRLPAADCAQEATAPTVVARSCDGWTVRVVAATHPDQDDAVVIRGPDRATGATLKIRTDESGGAPPP